MSITLDTHPCKKKKPGKRLKMRRQACAKRIGPAIGRGIKIFRTLQNVTDPLIFFTHMQN